MARHGAEIGPAITELREIDRYRLCSGSTARADSAAIRLASETWLRRPSGERV